MHMIYNSIEHSFRSRKQTLGMIEDLHGVNPAKRHPVRYNISSQVATLLNGKRDIGSLVESERRGLFRPSF